MKGTFWLLSLAVSLAACTTSQSTSSGLAAAEPVNATESKPPAAPVVQLQGTAETGSVFSVRGAAARQVYQQLATVGVRSQEGDQEVVRYSGSVGISCIRTGGVLPAGTRGFPLPIHYECQVRGAKKTSENVQDVVVLKNGAAKRFFGSLAATPMQSEEKVEKTYKGEIVITCRAAASFEGAKCEGLRVAH